MPTRPNILFILSDQQRWDTVGCYGQPLGQDLNLTPHLDALAARGTRFNNTFTCQPVCGPARSCLQTGLFASQTGCHTNGIPLDLEADTIARRCNDAGYRTAYVGKWHLASDRRIKLDLGKQATPIERRGGYKDHWLAADVLEFTSHGYEGFMFDTDGHRVDFEGYRVDCTAQFVLQFLRDHVSGRHEKPFFLFTSFIEPHQQNDLQRFVGPIGSKQRFANYPVPGDLAGTDGDWRQHLPDYLGCCWSLDQNVGRIMAELELLGLAENTVVIYTSDHGCHFCTRNSEYKRSCHEGSIHIPLIAAGPGFDGGGVRDEMVSLIDLPPTVLHAAGAVTPAALRGRALQPLVAGAAQDWPDDVFVQISESHCGRAVRTARWKYSVGAPDPWPGHAGADRYVEQFLYDLDADPHERSNLVTEPALAGVRAELAQRLKKRMMDAGEKEPVIEPAANL